MVVVMSGIQDPEKRPLYVDRKNGRFFAEPTLGTPWKEVVVTRDYTAGAGLDLAGSEFSVDLKSSSGLAIESGELALDLKSNGGLALESGELAVDLGASSITGTLAAADGGTGQASYSSGELLIGNASGGLTKASLTAGANITITPGDGSITIASAAGSSYSAGDGLDLTGSVFSADLKANGGLVIEASEIAVDLGATSITGTLGVSDGGTGQTSYTDGQLLIGNSTGNTLNKATLTAGTGIQVTNGSGSITIANTGPALGTQQTWTAVQTFVDPTITGCITEDVYTISDGAAFEVDPGNGSIQLITLGANRTPKATNFAAGESVTLMVNDGTAYTLTWSDATWGGSGVVWVGGTAPTLATSGYSVIQLWKVGTQVYGARVGDVA